MAFMSPTGDIPDPVTDLAASGTADGILLTWSSPAYQGTANMLNYILLKNSSEPQQLNGVWFNWTFIGFSLSQDIYALIFALYNYHDLGPQSYLDTQVVPGVTYQYVVMVMNPYGTATGFSNQASGQTGSSGTTPSAPRNLIATAGIGHVKLDWTAPLDSGTPAFTRYDVYRSTTAGSYSAPIAQVAAGILTYDDISVTGGTPYYYVVKAVNTQGSSVASNEQSATPSVPPRVPGAPSGLVATAGAGYILLNWTAPSNPGDPALTIYRIYRSESSGVLGSNIGNVSTGTVVFNDTTVIAGTPYYYVIKAANNAVGPASNEATATATPGPQAPSAVMSIGSTHGSNWVNLFWQMPSNPGNPAFTRYDIYRGASTGTLTYLTNVTSTTQTYNDTTALNGNTYVYSVKAVNTVGASPFGTYLTVELPVPGTPPGTPTGLSAVGHRNYITLSWTAPTDVGSGISNYLVYRGTTAGGEGSVPITSVTGTTFQDNSAVAGTPYFYKVKANNSYGQSTFSNEATGTALVNTAPSAPQSFTATAGVDKVTLAWLAPADNGGSAVTSYQIVRSTGGSAAAQIGSVAGSILTFVDTTGTAGTSYTYYVKAVNEIGAGTQSASQSATPQPSGGGTDNTILYAGIVIVIVVIVAILAFVMMRRPKTPPTPPKTP
jgi:predicted phage tail protein